MSHKLTTLAKNSDGQITFCTNCKQFQLTFNNIYIEFSKRELSQFRRLVNTIEIGYWEQKYDGVPMKRKIPISTKQRGLTMVFNKQEIISLRNLINLQTQKPIQGILQVVDIDYTLFLN